MHFKSFVYMLMEKIFQMVWNYFHSDNSAQKMILQKVKKCPKMAWMSLKIKVAQSLLYEGQLLQPHFFITEYIHHNTFNPGTSENAFKYIQTFCLARFCPWLSLSLSPDDHSIASYKKAVLLYSSATLQWL